MMGAGGLENPPCDRGVGTFAVPTHQRLVGRGQGLEAESYRQWPRV